MKTFLKKLPFWPVTIALAVIMGLGVWIFPEGTGRWVTAFVVGLIWTALLLAHINPDSDKPNQPRK